MTTMDWRDPRRRIKTALGGVLLGGFRIAGRFEPLRESETRLRQSNAAPFFGDVRGTKGVLKDHEERRVVFETPPPKVEEVRDVYYTPDGCAWRGGALVERYGIRRTALREVLSRPRASTAIEVPRGALVQSDGLYTYGDWVHTYLGTLLRAGELDRPLIVPECIGRRSYVQRDLALANVSYMVARRPVVVRDAIVLRKRNALLCWDRADVEAYQRVFAPHREAPRSGSLTYFGRFDLVGEIGAREYPSDTVATIAKRLGGNVVKQELLSPVTSPDFAEHVETVIGDHGSGMVNIMHWRPKTVIELTVNGWWCNAHLFAAEAMGVENYAVFSVDGLDEVGITRRLQACFDRFGLTPKGTARRASASTRQPVRS